jgi:hypothetical protein
MTVIAYTYDADYHCIDCTKKYVRNNEPPESVQAVLDGEEEYSDSEGNPIHPVFSTDEWYANDIYEGNAKATLSCSTCGNVIEEVELG